MNQVLRAAGTLLLIMGAGQAIAQSDGNSAWRAMTFHDFRQPSSDVLQTVVWPDVIAAANAYTENELKRPLKGRNALVTALSSTYLRIPIQSGRVFRFEAGHRSDLMSATIPI